MITRPPSSNQKKKVEEHPRKGKSSLNKMNFVSEPISNAHVKHSMRNAKFESICVICNKCLFDANHDMCVIDYVNDVNVVQIVLWYFYSGCSKHMTRNRSQLINFVSKFVGTVGFGNDHIAKIMGYGDYQQWLLISSRPGPKLLTPGIISSGLYLKPPPCVDPQVLAVIAPKPVVSTGTPSSTIIDKDAPSPSTSQTTQETPSLVIPLGVEEANHDIKVAHMDNNSSLIFQFQNQVL
ncbi:hypothetical protein Tco_0596702 [Tanacetum coccineum]